MILITGGTGFIGKKLLSGLIAEGHDIRLLSRKMVEGHKTTLCDFREIDFNIGDIKDVKTVFHLAGYAHDISNNNDDLYQLINVDATVRLANLAGIEGVKNFVFISSVKAGGYRRNSELSEDTQYEPDGIYGKTKREAELRVLEIGEKYDMKVSIIRPSLVYGPEVKGNLMLMSSGISKGWFPPLPKTGNRRSMIHVDDLVNAILIVSKRKGDNNEIFIATDGHIYSSREIYEKLCIINGKPIPNWSVPVFVFKLLGYLSPKFSLKVNKLLGDEYYSSKKLNSLGFSAKKVFEEMNESSL